MSGFKICFNLDVAVMLETVVSVVVGLANGRWILKEAQSLKPVPAFADGIG